MANISLHYLDDPNLTGGFLIGSSLLGLLVIIWAFWYNRSNLSFFKRACAMSLSCQGYGIMSGQVIYNTLLTLLINDAVKLIVAIVFGAALISSSCSSTISCESVEYTWNVSRWLALNIHLVNASFCIYNLCRPMSVIKFRLIELLVNVMNVIIIPLNLFIPKAAVFTLAAFMFLFALSVIVTSAVYTSPSSTATLKKLIVVVAMCNFLVVHFPTFIVQCLMYTNIADFAKYQNVYFKVQVFTNLHLIFDGLQCALFMKVPSRDEQQQQQQQEQQQQQKLGYQNTGFTDSTNA